jgi:DNA-binding response OmpR family regulator
MLLYYDRPSVESFMRLLFAEDEKDLNDVITKRLVQRGYTVDSCLDGLETWDYVSSCEYDAVILDIMMPGLDGVEVLAKMRNAGIRAPVLFLTAKASVEDRVAGLDRGANDYLVKPFAFEELLARIRVLIRDGGEHLADVCRVGDLTLDRGKRIVTRGDRHIDLSGKEFGLLEYLVHNKGAIMSRERIEDHVWGYTIDGGTNVVDVYISYLRKKIDGGFDRKLIKTVRGLGYMISEGE